LDTETPRTRDGREYPEHLRPFEAFDDRFLPLLSGADRLTFDDLSLMVDDGQARAVLARWLASAEWRGLIERRDPERGHPRTWVLGDRGRARLTTAA
jgi:hypothetical protein